MNPIIKFLQFLLVENTGPTKIIASSQVLEMKLTFDVIGLILLIAFLIISFEALLAHKELRKQLLSIFLLEIALFLRIFVLILQNYVLLATATQYNIGYLTTMQTFPWLIVYIMIISILVNLIKVPKNREKNQRRIINYSKFNIVVTAFTFILGLLSDSGFVNTIQAGYYASLLLLITIIILWISYALVIKESNNSASALTKIRLRMIGYGLLSIAISFSIVPFVIVFAIIGIYNIPIYQLSYEFIAIVLNVTAGYFFYGAFFTPNYMKKRYGLVTDMASLI